MSDETLFGCACLLCEDEADQARKAALWDAVGEPALALLWTVEPRLHELARAYAGEWGDWYLDREDEAMLDRIRALLATTSKQP